LTHLHLLASELGAACKSGQIVGDRFGRVVHDLADLRGGLALQREADDLSAMCENWPKIVECAAHRYQNIWMCAAHNDQVAGDGSWSHEEDAIGEVFGSEQCPLTEGLLAKIKKSTLAKAGRTMLLDQEIVELAPMQGETDGLLLAMDHWLSGWLVSGDSDESDRSRRSLRTRGGEEGKVDFFDDVENCLGLEGRTVQSVLNLGGEASIEGLGLQSLDGFAVQVSNAHR
jgi:hypothetical protein